METPDTTFVEHVAAAAASSQVSRRDNENYDARWPLCFGFLSPGSLPVALSWKQPLPRGTNSTGGRQPLSIGDRSQQEAAERKTRGAPEGVTSDSLTRLTNSEMNICGQPIKY